MRCSSSAVTSATVAMPRRAGKRTGPACNTRGASPAAVKPGSISPKRRYRPAVSTGVRSCQATRGTRWSSNSWAARGPRRRPTDPARRSEAALAAPPFCAARARGLSRSTDRGDLGRPAAGHRAQDRAAPSPRPPRRSERSASRRSSAARRPSSQQGELDVERFEELAGAASGRRRARRWAAARGIRAGAWRAARGPTT